jgi:hypothetical protein
MTLIQLKEYLGLNIILFLALQHWLMPTSYDGHLLYIYRRHEYQNNVLFIRSHSNSVSITNSKIFFLYLMSCLIIFRYTINKWWILNSLI